MTQGPLEPPLQPLAPCKCPTASLQRQQGAQAPGNLTHKRSSLPSARGGSGGSPPGCCSCGGCSSCWAAAITTGARLRRLGRPASPAAWPRTGAGAGLSEPACSVATMLAKLECVERRATERLTGGFGAAAAPAAAVKARPAGGCTELLPQLLFLSTGAPLTWPWRYILETPSAR